MNANSFASFSDVFGLKTFKMLSAVTLKFFHPI